MKNNLLVSFINPLIFILITIYTAKIIVLANYSFCRLSIIKITRLFDGFLVLFEFV